MTENDAAEALRVANEVHEITGKILDRLDATGKYARQSRRVSWFGAGLAALALLIGAAFGYGLYEIRQGQLHACAIGNDLRAGQLRIWNRVIDLSSQPPPGETPAQRATRIRNTRNFKLYVDNQERQVNCGKLYPGYLPNLK